MFDKTTAETEDMTKNHDILQECKVNKSLSGQSATYKCRQEALIHCRCVSLGKGGGARLLIENFSSSCPQKINNGTSLSLQHLSNRFHIINKSRLSTQKVLKDLWVLLSTPPTHSEVIALGL